MNHILTPVTPVTVTAQQPSPSDAAIANGKFAKVYWSKESLLTIEETFNRGFGNNTHNMNYLTLLVKKLKRILIEENNYHSFDDLPIVKSIPVNLSDIRNDTIIQRDLISGWISNLLNNFDPLKVMPLNVFEVTDEHGKTRYSAWDGQHTAVLLYIIAVYVYDMDINDVKVPVAIYDTNNKGKIRKNFTALNSDQGKRAITIYTLWVQRTYSVIIDGSKDPIDLRAKKLLDTVMKYDSFICEERSGKKNEIDINSAIKKFCLDSDQHELLDYALRLHKMFLPQKNITSNAVDRLMHFFSHAKARNIEIDDAYINIVGQVFMNVFNLDFDVMLRSRLKAAYDKWWRDRGIGLNNDSEYPRCSYSGKMIDDFLSGCLVASKLFDHKQVPLIKEYDFDHALLQ